MEKHKVPVHKNTPLKIFIIVIQKEELAGPTLRSTLFKMPSKIDYIFHLNVKLAVQRPRVQGELRQTGNEWYGACHEKANLKVFLVIPKEGLVGWGPANFLGMTPTLQLYCLHRLYSVVGVIPKVGLAGYDDRP